MDIQVNLSYEGSKELMRLLSQKDDKLFSFLEKSKKSLTKEQTNKFGIEKVKTKFSN